MLACDPPLEVLPATINATVDSLNATIMSGALIMKNNPIEAANYFLGASLLTTARVSDNSISRIRRPVFFPMSASGAHFGKAFKPFSLEKINDCNSLLSESSPECEYPRLILFCFCNS
jgi:hypothetical protein